MQRTLKTYCGSLIEKTAAGLRYDFDKILVATTAREAASQLLGTRDVRHANLAELMATDKAGCVVALAAGPDHRLAMAVYIIDPKVRN